MHQRLKKIKLTVRYLIGFASIFTKRSDRSVCVDTLEHIPI